MEERKSEEMISCIIKGCTYPQWDECKYGCCRKHCRCKMDLTTIGDKRENRTIPNSSYAISKYRERGQGYRNDLQVS